MSKLIDENYSIEVVVNKKNLNSSFESENTINSIEVKYEDLEKEYSLSEEQLKLISSISQKLEKIIENNNYYEYNNDEHNLLINAFNSKEFIDIPIYEFLTRIIMYFNCQDSSLIISLIYLDKLIMKNININKYNIYQILFTCLLISVKYNEDNIYKNNYYSEIIGITLEELNLLEYNLYYLLDFNAYIKNETYEYYKKGL
jgi:hypothetical protein